MDSGRRIRDMGKVIRTMQIQADTKESGQMIRDMDKVEFKYKE